MQSKLYINGKWVGSETGNQIQVVDPATEQVFHHVAAAGKTEVYAAVAAAKDAFDHGPWPKMSGTDRGKILRKMASEIELRTAELAQLEVLDNGKPLPEAVWDIEDVAECFKFYAGLAEEHDTLPPQKVELADERFTSKVLKQPVGVVGAIIPWNFPMLMAAWKVAPALAAGCTMVLKPSEVTPITALELSVIADKAGLPRGVLNIITGLGADAGAPLVEHPDIDKIAFTGSLQIGSKIMSAAARDIKNISLELGGKSPFIVFADSDIDAAVEWILFGIFWNQGEVCSATSRVLVEKSLYSTLLGRLAEEAKNIKIGRGNEDGVLLGPLVNKAQYEKVMAAIEKGKIEGAQLVTGGKRPAHLKVGYFIEPTIFANVDRDSWIWKEEIFGPVVCVNSFDTEREAISVANDSEYGLAAAVMSKDLARAERVAEALQAGIVWINCSQPTFVGAPWGGKKKSGIGRELGKWGFESYLDVKQVTTYLSDSPWAWYIK